jgi:hypothetical protein
MTSPDETGATTAASLWRTSWLAASIRRIAAAAAQQAPTDHRLFDRRIGRSPIGASGAPGESATTGIGEIRHAVIGKGGKALCFATPPRLWKRRMLLRELHSGSRERAVSN